MSNNNESDVKPPIVHTRSKNDIMEDFATDVMERITTCPMCAKPLRVCTPLGMDQTIKRCYRCGDFVVVNVDLEGNVWVMYKTKAVQPLALVCADCRQRKCICMGRGGSGKPKTRREKNR